MKFNNVFITLLLITVPFIFSCSDDDDEVAPADQSQVSLNQITDGQGAVVTTGAVSLDWEGNATWDLTSTSLVSNGVSYYVWEVILEGPTVDDYIRIQIVEDQDQSTEEGPDDGTYILGGSMDQNDISVYTSADSYFFDNSSDGEFELTKAGNVFQITLQATGLEKGGIGSSDELIDVNLAVKATEL